MKTERMYENLQARYRREQKKLALQMAEEKANQEKKEQEAKAELKNILCTLLDTTKKAIEDIPGDMLYEAYEEVKKGIKKNTVKRKRRKENIYIECHIEGEKIYFEVICNNQSCRTSQWNFDFDRTPYDNLYQLLKNAYPGINFGGYTYKVRFFLADETLNLQFHLSMRAIMAADDDNEIREQTKASVKRFSEDVKEFFQDAKISRVGRKKDYLNLTIKL